MKHASIGVVLVFIATACSEEITVDVTKGP